VRPMALFGVCALILRRLAMATYMCTSGRLQNPSLSPFRPDAPSSRFPCPCRIPSHTKTRTGSLIRHSRGKSWHVGYAHSCGPQGARKTVPSAIRRFRYRRNAKRRPRWAGCGECWKYSWCFGSGANRREDEAKSSFGSHHWSLMGSLPRLRWLVWPR